MSSRRQRWASDVIVDLLQYYDLPYATMNPGASYRGLHDSIVNYGANQPTLMVCQHEETAVQIAHGYAKASGRPMAAILHDLVGLLHANLAIYSAYADRCPVFLIGATGPMDESKRRPRIDWVHTAQSQGEAVRAYTKWDYQPHSVDGVSEAVARAYGVMMAEPRGPVYLCFDAWLQEQPLERGVALPPGGSARVPSRLAPDPESIARVADFVAAADRPVIIAEYVGRDAEGFDGLVRLAELAALPVYDVDSRLNFPSRHPLNVTHAKDIFRDADLVLALDTRDWERPTTELESASRGISSLVGEATRWVDVGFGDLELSSWALDYQRFRHADLRVTADTTVAIPMLGRLLEGRLGRDPGFRSRVERRRKEVAARTAQLRRRWEQEARADWDAGPMTLPRLASEVWDAIRAEDWVLTAGTLEHWARKLWDFDRPYRHPGRSLGAATQIGISLGVALAHRDRGRLVVDLQPDGDLMYDAGALWVAAKHRIPLLVVMHNNRAYYNDWEHQLRIARLRGRAGDSAHIGNDLDDPAPDFAGLARAMGWYAEGPFESADGLGAALARAVANVKAGTPALIDAVTRRR